MKILYRQNNGKERLSPFSLIGVYQCYFKEIEGDRDKRFVTKKEHSHMGYEIHIVADGEQTYEIGCKLFDVCRGSFLLIPPGIRHRIVKGEGGMRKYSVSFSVRSDKESALSGYKPDTVCDKCPRELFDVCSRISAEAQRNTGLSGSLIENAVFELTVGVLRLCGFDEGGGACEAFDENARVELAKKYIKDNIDLGLSVPDVASYCYISEKQLTRLFLTSEGSSVGEYIRAQRILRIEELLRLENLSLKEISRVMNFNNEYYFNMFFKKYYGMPPGEYRKTILPK